MTAAALKHSTAIIAPDPFCARRKHMCIPPGLTIAQVVAQAAANDNLPPRWNRGLLRIYVGGVEIPSGWWARTRLKDGQHVAIISTPRDDNSKVFRTLLTIAVIAATAWIGGGGLVGLLGNGTFGAFTAGSVAASLAAAGVSMIGGVLINALAPAQNNNSAAASQAYSLAGARNAARPYQPMNVVLGRRRFAPPLAATTYTETVGDDVYLRGLVQWHIGYGELSSLKIGETPIEAYDGVTLEHRLQPGDPFPSLYPRIVREEQLQVALTHDGGWVQRRTQRGTTTISIDLGFPTGLLRSTSDGNRPATVQVQVQYRAIDSDTWEAPPGFGSGVITYSENKDSPFRRNIAWDVDEGQYDVQILRVTADAETNKVADQVYWTALRSMAAGAPFLLDTAAVTAFRIKASEQLNGTVDTLNGVFQAHMPLWDSEAGEFTGLGATRNPAEIAHWLATGPANDRPLSDDRLYTAQLGAWAERCAEKDWKCDHIIDGGGTLEQALRIVAGCGRGFGALWLDGKLSVAVDDAQPVPVQIFSARNVRNFTGTIAFPGALHAVNVQFADETADFQTSTRTVYADGYSDTNATLFETIDAAGKTDPAEAWVVGWRYLAGRLLRPEAYSFDADLEGLTVRIGQRVDVAHYRMSVGQCGTRVRKLVLDGDGNVAGVVLDDVTTMEAGKDYVLRVQSGAAIALLSVTTVAGDSRTVTFPDALAPEAAPRAGDHVVFGEYGKETLPMIVVGLGPQPDKTSKVLGIPYAEALQADGGDVPDWDPLITPRPMNAPAVGAVVPGGDRIVQETVLKTVLAERGERMAVTEVAGQAKVESDFLGGDLVNRLDDIQVLFERTAQIDFSRARSIQELRRQLSASEVASRADYNEKITAAATAANDALVAAVTNINVSIDGKASSASVLSLTNRVTVAEGDITSISGSLTTLTGTVNNPTNGLPATYTIATGAAGQAATNADDISVLAAQGATLSATIGGSYSPSSTVATAIAAKADSSDLTATADLLDELDASFGNVFASVKARFSAATAPGDAAARIGLSVSATDGGAAETAAMYIDALSAGGSRIMLQASSVYILSGPDQSALSNAFVFSGGTLYLAQAAIKNADIGTLKLANGAVSDPQTPVFVNGSTGSVMGGNTDISTAVTASHTYDATGWVELGYSGACAFGGSYTGWQGTIVCIRSDGTQLPGTIALYSQNYSGASGVGGGVSGKWFDTAPINTAGVTYKLQFQTIAGHSPAGSATLTLTGYLTAVQFKK